MIDAADVFSFSSGLLTASMMYTYSGSVAGVSMSFAGSGMLLGSTGYRPAGQWLPLQAALLAASTFCYVYVKSRGSTVEACGCQIDNSTTTTEGDKE